MKLLVSDYEVHMANEITNSEFLVKFQGPKESPYEGVSVNSLENGVREMIYRKIK